MRDYGRANSTVRTATEVWTIARNRAAWTLVVSRTNVPQVVQAERPYRNVNALMREVGDARVWAGLHWRHAFQHGAQIGRKVASFVTRRFFKPRD